MHLFLILSGDFDIKEVLNSTYFFCWSSRRKNNRLDQVILGVNSCHETWIVVFFVSNDRHATCWGKGLRYKMMIPISTVQPLKTQQNQAGITWWQRPYGGARRCFFQKHKLAPVLNAQSPFLKNCIFNCCAITMDRGNELTLFRKVVQNCQNLGSRNITLLESQP